MVSVPWLEQPESGAAVPNFVGFDHHTYAPVSLSRALWLRGFADRAKGIAKKAIDGRQAAFTNFDMRFTGVRFAGLSLERRAPKRRKLYRPADRICQTTFD